MAEDVSDDLDRLYAEPLGNFVEARNALARRLREQGDAEQATEVAALRKPTVPVWAANQLARRNRRDVDLLLDAAHRLRAAVAGSDAQEAREDFERARRAERDALGRLRRATEDVLREGGSSAGPAMVERVLATLRAAALTEQGRELLARGRLAEEMAVTGFELVEDLAPRRSRAARRRSIARERRDEVADARAALREAKARHQEARRALREAERREDDARRELEAAEGARRGAEHTAEEAERAVDEAQAALDRLQRS